MSDKAGGSTVSKRNKWPKWLDYRHGYKSIVGKLRELQSIIGACLEAESRGLYNHYIKLATSTEDQIRGIDYYHQEDGWSRPYSVSVKSSPSKTNALQVQLYKNWFMIKGELMYDNLPDRLSVVNDKGDSVTMDMAVGHHLADTDRIHPFEGSVFKLTDLPKRGRVAFITLE